MAPPTQEQVEDAYRRYFPVIARKCGRMLRSPTEAQDVAQEVFLRLWKGRLELRDAGATTAWLYRTCTHLAIERIRARARHGESPSELADALASPEPGLDERADHRRELAELVGALPTDELEAALLSRVDRLTHPEIGEVLGVSERTVRRLLTRLDVRLAAWRARREVAA
jgi:RNA polymerase sigma-70 factor (ECF subfamily)